MRLSKPKLIALTVSASILSYLTAPVFYALPAGKLSSTIYMLLLKTNPLIWNRLLSIIERADCKAEDELCRLLSSTPETYWDLAIEIICAAPKHMCEDTVHVLLTVRPEKWSLIKQAVKLYLSGYTPFTPPSEELMREYVKPLAISGEEPIRDWRYMVYIFTYRLIYDKKSVWEAARTICSYVHEYLTYDTAFWHRRSPKTLIVQKKGTCTNFSILFVAMCRSMGIPARLVRDNSISPVTHAWSEFYLEGRGWVHVDATAGYFDYPQAYLREWGYQYHLVKAFNPLKGWIDITPSYTDDYGLVVGLLRLNNKPLKGVSVSVYYPENKRIPLIEIETDANGTFEFTAASGSYIITASYGKLTKSTKITIQTNRTLKVEINMG